VPRADRLSIVALMVGQGLRRAFVGAAIGLTAALAAGRVLQSLLCETPAIDLRSHGAAVALVLVVAVTAAWLPAARAATVNPVTALRDD
jgi:putative ABC transport system permease protein